jgi:hypothetical protein
LKTLSEHIFDLAQNSINAGASSILIRLEENLRDNVLTITVKDDGQGIKPDNLSKVKETFFTTRPHSKRHVGLGLALMDATCQQAGGELTVESEYRHGATVVATMLHDHIDRPPTGDIPDLFASLMMSTAENKVMWTLEHNYEGREYRLRNRATLDELNVFSYSEPGVRDLLYQLIGDKERKIHKNK